MNVGHPAYQEFMATVWAPHICEDYDGIYFDTVPPTWPASGGVRPCWSTRELVLRRIDGCVICR